MTIQMNIADAKARLSELIDAALQGEDVVLARAGKPVARIVMAGPAAQKSSLFGALAHLGPVPEAALEPEPSDAWFDFGHDASPSYPIAAEPDHKMLGFKGG